jgi:hypothetical protein
MKRLFGYVRNQWAGFLALFLVLAGGTAYAAGITSNDIIDGEVKTQDLANQAVTGAKLGSASVSKGKVAGNTIDGARIVDNSVGGADIAEDAVGTTEVADGAIQCEHFTWCKWQGLNFGTIAANNCARVAGDASSHPFFSITDLVVVTPSEHFADTFTLTAKVDEANQQIIYVACNVFGSGSADPDGAGGGAYRTAVG